MSPPALRRIFAITLPSGQRSPQSTHLGAVTYTSFVRQGDQRAGFAFAYRAPVRAGGPSDRRGVRCNRLLKLLGTYGNPASQGPQGTTAGETILNSRFNQSIPPVPWLTKHGSNEATVYDCADTGGAVAICHLRKQHWRGVTHTLARRLLRS